MRFKYSIWRKYISVYWVVAIIFALLAVGVVIFLGYRLKWDWTGFPTKTLWDWLNLLAELAIPAAVGFGTIWLTRQHAKVSDAENKDNQYEAALQMYIDRMSELLLERKLRESAEEDEVRCIAHTRTLIILRRLDAIRKASVLKFLHHSGLIDKNKRIIDLRTAMLSGAILSLTDLSGTDLSGAMLSGADLSLTNLSQADLREADLSLTDLSGADLSGAHLKDVIGITIQNLEKQARSLTGATLPDGSKHP